MIHPGDPVVRPCVRCKKMPNSKCRCGRLRERKPGSVSDFYEKCYRCRRSKTYRQHLGPCCVVCGFVPKHPCQLDADHIDGNHANNEPGNIRTLCANCHRLKTHLERRTKLGPDGFPAETDTSKWTSDDYAAMSLWAGDDK